MPPEPGGPRDRGDGGPGRRGQALPRSRSLRPAACRRATGRDPPADPGARSPVEVIGPTGADVSGIEVVAQGASALSKEPWTWARRRRPGRSLPIPSCGEAEVTPQSRGAHPEPLARGAGSTHPGDPAREPGPRRARDVAVTARRAGRPGGRLRDRGRANRPEEPEQQRVRTLPTGEAQLAGLVPGAAYEVRILDGERRDVWRSRWIPKGGRSAPGRDSQASSTNVEATIPRCVRVPQDGSEFGGFVLAAGGTLTPDAHGTPVHVEGFPVHPVGQQLRRSGTGRLGRGVARAGEPVTLVVQRASPCDSV
jgi:hypothetical protein